MKNKKIKSWFISFVLLIFLISIFLINHFVFVVGSYHAIENEYKEAQTKMVLNNQILEVKFVSRMATDQVYYVSNGVYNLKSHLLWYNKKGELLFVRESYTRKDDKVRLLINEKYPQFKFELSLGVYSNNPVYVLKNKQQEIYLDYDSLEEIFNWNKE